jgi:hypothetical protein
VAFGLIDVGVDPHSPLLYDVLQYVGGFVKRMAEDITSETRMICVPALLLLKAGEAVNVSQLLQRLRSYRIKGKGWPLRPGEDCNLYDSAYAVRTFLNAGQMNAEIRESINWIMTERNLDGGFPRHPSSPSDLAASAMTTIMLSESNAKSTDLNRSRRFLIQKMNTRGGWQAGWEIDPIHEHGKWFHFNSAYCVEALLKAGAPLRGRPVQASMQRLLRYQDPSGGWRPIPSIPPTVWGTGYALRALAEYLRRAD